MKKILILLLTLALAVFAAACGADDSQTHGAESWAKDWGITLSVREVSPTGLTLVCTQSGGIAEGSLETGSAYTIEKYENDHWVEVKPQGEAIWDMMAYLIASEATTEWTIDWSWLYGELSPGTYRINKTVADFKESGASESQIYFAEFEIKG
ncbi:MAG: hypothetical protein IKM11_05775 [Oscillospiraceae bacterium]|nr:hypothetical protein [Oscillospiraceae bacterium]